MLTKTVRSRFSHEVGDKVEGCTIVEKIVVAQPVPAEQRRGIYDYIVEVPPAAAKETRKRAISAAAPRETASPRAYRATPDRNGLYAQPLPD